MKMAAGALARHGAGAALRTTLLRSSGPSPSRSPAAALRASPASPLFGGPPLLSRLRSPEVDVAAWQRGGGGRRSASGETGPGLVFVNLPRSRRGERRPRAWHGVPGAWRGRRAAEETAGGRARQVSGTDLELHQENSTWKPRLVDSRFFRQEAEVRERLRILGTPVFLLEDTEFFEKTVQYGKGTERTGRSRYCDLVTVLQTTSVLRKTGTENF